jgi:hypothetical protein
MVDPHTGQWHQDSVPIGGAGAQHRPEEQGGGQIEGSPSTNQGSPHRAAGSMHDGTAPVLPPRVTLEVNTRPYTDRLPGRCARQLAAEPGTAESETELNADHAGQVVEHLITIVSPRALLRTARSPGPRLARRLVRRDSVTPIIRSRWPGALVSWH